MNLINQMKYKLEFIERKSYLCDHCIYVYQIVYESGECGAEIYSTNEIAASKVLSQNGSSFISDEVKFIPPCAIHTRVKDNAKVLGSSQIYTNIIVKDNAELHSAVIGNIDVCGSEYDDKYSNIDCIISDNVQLLDTTINLTKLMDKPIIYIGGYTYLEYIDILVDCADHNNFSAANTSIAFYNACISNKCSYLTIKLILCTPINITWNLTFDDNNINMYYDWFINHKLSKTEQCKYTNINYIELQNKEFNIRCVARLDDFINEFC